MKIAWLSNFSILGSGYKHISVPLCEGLTNAGHEVKAIGIDYDGSEHWFNFQLLPARNMQEATGILSNLAQKWGVDILVVALDIPLQLQLLKILKPRPFKYIGIMPVEADPLLMDWAILMNEMDWAYIISDFGAKEAKKAGVIKSEHLQIGVDTDAWKRTTVDARTQFRKALGISEDEKVILTVAHNYERKNITLAMDIVSKVKEKYDKVRYILVTKEQHAFGWNIMDYARKVGISSNLMIFERGIDFSKLWGLYSISDVFLLSSKAEGLSLPILEAMSVGIPVVATNCTAMVDHLQDGRGYLVDYEYTHIDCFGNGKRYWISPEDGAEKVITALESGTEVVEKAYEYVKGRKWSDAVNQMDSKIR